MRGAEIAQDVQQAALHAPLRVLDVAEVEVGAVVARERDELAFLEIARPLEPPGDELRQGPDLEALRLDRLEVQRERAMVVVARLVARHVHRVVGEDRDSHRRLK
jgi:hypothetical protein